jgi:hypothetical protein
MPAASSVVPLLLLRVVNTLRLLYYYYWKLLLLLLVAGRNIKLNNTCQLASLYCCRLEQLFMNVFLNSATFIHSASAEIVEGEIRFKYA